MGNTEAVKNNQEIELRINHPQLQNGRIVANNGQNLIKVAFPMPEKEYNQWADNLLKYHKSTSKILLPLRHNFKKAGLCGQLGTAEVYYPNFPYLLSDEIYDRKGKKNDFSEQEMWYLLYSIVKAKKQNEDHSKVMGDIRPKNIFLNEEGSIKVPNSVTWPYENSKLAKALSNFVTYLSPEEVKSLNLNEKQFAKFEEVGEMFAIGVTLLSLGNLVDYEQLYDLNKKSLDESKFLEALLLWSEKRKYSQVLRGLIINLCSHDPDSRMTEEEMWTLLSKHEENIAKKNNFIIDNAPEKLHLGVKQLRRMLIEPQTLRENLLGEWEVELQNYFKAKTS